MKLRLNRYQENLWKYANLYPAEFYNLGLSFCLSPKLRPDLLKRAFEYVLNSTEVLSAVLVSDDDFGTCFETENKAPFIFECCDSTLDACRKDMEYFTREPFDLSSQWPIRVKLYHLPDQSFMLAIVFHHIGIDGVSVRDLLEMLACVYNSLDEQERYPDLKVPSWSDYMNGPGKIDRDLGKQDLDYWKNLLVDKNCKTIFPEVSVSPTDYTCQFMNFELGEHIMSNVNHVARQNGTTSFLIILAAWMFVLRRFSGQDTIFVDNPINMRPAKSRNLIGFFVNSLPYALAFDETCSVKDLFFELTRQHKMLKPSRKYTITEILGALENERMTSALGKANIGINFVGWSDSLIIPLKNVDCHFYERLDHFSALDLLLEVEPTKVGLSRICYRADFSEDYVRVLMNSLKETLRAFVANPDQKLSEIALLPHEQIKALMLAYEKRLDQLLPVEESINERFERMALSYPEQLALIYDEKSISYQDFHEFCERGARLLRTAYRLRFKEEIKAGEPIGIYTADKFKAILWIFTILRAGGAYVSLDFSYPKERIAFLVRDYGIRSVLSDREEALNVFPSSVLCLSLEEKEPVPVQEILPQVDKSSLAYIISTSGTTGQPKGVPIRHEQVLTLLQSGLFVSGPHQRVLQFASLCFDVSVWEIFGTLLNGSTLVIATEEQRHDIVLLKELLISKRVSVALIPPVLLSRFPHQEMPDLTDLWVGGDSISGNVIEYWKKGRRFYNGYGPTEATVCATACEMGDLIVANDIGLPLIGVTCYVLDSNLNSVPDYVWGELYIGGPQVTSGYINRPELNKEKFIPNPYATVRDRELGRNLVLYKSGDWVSRLPNGYLLFHGRIDFQVKINGFRVELGEIESQLNQYPAVARSVVLVKTVADDKRLVAYILPAENYRDTLSGRQLKIYLSESLPYYMIPSKWIFVKSFPLTINGKIDLKALPDPDMGEDTDADIVAPESAEERLLERVVAEVCKMDRVSVDADLFDMGISSIEVMMVIAQAANLGLELSVSRFYQGKTIRAIVRDNKAQFCFWADGTVTDEDKPILLLVCGDAYFNPDYQYFVDRFGKDYAILVLDSYHAYFTSRENLGWEELMNVYRRLVANVLGDRVPKLIAGFCIGGEMALSVASLFAECDSKPTLVLLDSFANRRKWGIWSFDYTESLGMLRERLIEETSGLLKSQVLDAYPGDIYLFLANRFTTEHVQDADKKGVEERVYGQFSENASAWRELVPQCRIEWIESDHWHMLDRLAIDRIYDRLTHK